MLAALRDVTPRQRVGTVTALFGATGPLGFAIGPVLGALVVDGLRLPLVAVFWLGSALSIAVDRPDPRGLARRSGRGRPRGQRALARAPGDRRRLRGPGRAPHLRDLRRLHPGQPDSPTVPPAPGEDVNGGAASLASAIGLVTGPPPSSGPSSRRWRVRSATGSASGACWRVRSSAPGRCSSSCPSPRAVAALAGIAVVYAALQAATQAWSSGSSRWRWRRNAIGHPEPRAPAPLPRRVSSARPSGRFSPASAGGVGAPFAPSGVVFLVGGLAVAVSLRRAGRGAWTWSHARGRSRSSASGVAHVRADEAVRRGLLQHVGRPARMAGEREGGREQVGWQADALEDGRRVVLDVGLERPVRATSPRAS